MRLSDIQPFPILAASLSNVGMGEVIYEGSVPTNLVASTYVQLLQNGSFKTAASQMGMIEGVVMVSINVKLLGTGQTNTIKENQVLESFDSLFENNKTIAVGSYHFSLDSTNLVFSGRGITSGYSTKIINLLVKIY